MLQGCAGSPSRAPPASASSSTLQHSSPPAAHSTLSQASGTIAPTSSAVGPSSDTVGSHTIQRRYKLAPTTFKTLCSISSSPLRRDVLQKACFATELRSFPIRQTEKAFFRHINDHTAIPYPITEHISQPWHKVFLLVQIDLHRTGWPSKISAATRKELHSEKEHIYKIILHALRCLVEILGEREDGKGTSVALDVLRSVSSGVWEGSEKELLQVEGIGPAKMTKLAQAGVRTIAQLRQLDFFRIERLLSRNPPYGHQMLHQLAGFPVLILQVDVLGEYCGDHVQVFTSDPQPSECSTTRCIALRITMTYGNEKPPAWKRQSLWTTLVIEASDGRLAWFWRGSSKGLVDGKEIVVRVLAKRGEQLKTTFACERVVGTLLRGSVQL